MNFLYFSSSTKLSYIKHNVSGLIRETENIKNKDKHNWTGYKHSHKALSL